MINLDNVKSRYIRALKIKYNKSLKPRYNIISLGPNCYPKTILTRWKYKKTKECGELTMPFDLAWFHQASYITEFLSNDFENFLSNLKYQEHVQSWDNEGKINFSHEKNFGPNDQDKLISMYTKRIENFKASMNSNAPILFIQILKNKTVNEDINNLYDILKTKRGLKPFELVIIDTIDIVKDTNEKINILKTAPLDENTDVYSEKFYKSNEGRILESQIINYCAQIIRKNLKCSVTKFM